MSKAILTNFNFKNQKGLSLIELIVAIAFFVLVVSGVIFLVLDAHSANRQGQERNKATQIAQEGLEAARSMKNRAWKYLSNGVHGLSDSKGYWDFNGTADTIDQFTRQVKVENVSRQNGDIVSSGGTVDLDTKKVTSEVTWEFTPLRPSHVVLETYFTNWKSTKWQQTSYAHFNDPNAIRNHVVATNKKGGELELEQADRNYWGNQFIITSTSSIGAMNTQQRRTALRFTAQKNKTVEAIRVYLEQEVGTSPAYIYGLQGDSNGSPSGTWLGATRRGYGMLQATQPGWLTIDLLEAVNLNANQVYHLVVQWRLGTVNNSNYIALRSSAPQNLLIPFNNAVDSSSNVLWNSGTGWSVQNSQPIYELDFADNTYEGNPYFSAQDESIYGNNYVSEKIAVKDQDKAISEIGFYAKKNANQDPADNLYVTLFDVTNNTMVEQGTLASASQVSTSYAWLTYSLTSRRILLNSHTYRIYLSSPNSQSNRYYQVSSINTTDSNNYNSITFNGTDSVFSSSNNGGTNWSDRNYADISGFRLTLSISYFQQGDFTSVGYNSTSNNPIYNYLCWTASVPAGTGIKFQLRTATSLAGLASANWQGPDGTLGTFYTTLGETISIATDKQYIQYKVYFSSDGTTTPTLEDVTIDYEI